MSAPSPTTEREIASQEVRGHAEPPDGLGDVPWLLRLWIVAGPVGLLIVLLLAFWIAGFAVRSTVIVQTDPEWTAGGTAAVRVQLLDGGRNGVAGAQAEATLQREGAVLATLKLDPVAVTGFAQGRFDLAEVEAGDAELVLEVVAPDGRTRTERVPVVVVHTATREATDTYSTSIAQRGDDTDPQPANARLDVFPDIRVNAGFENTFWIRTLEPTGAPHPGRVDVRLVSGEFRGHRGQSRDAPLIETLTTNAAGLGLVRGELELDVIRLKVATSSGIARIVRHVSFAGSVQIDVEPRFAKAGDEVDLHVRALRDDRPLVVDVHSPSGAWIDTLGPYTPGQPNLRWKIPDRTDVHGVLQFEAYAWTNAPGESTAIARLYALAPGEDAPLPRLASLMERTLDEPRIDRHFDADLERRYLAALRRAALDGPSRESASGFLLATLPTAVYGPGVATSTWQRDLDAVHTRRETWKQRVRIGLALGALVFVVTFVIAMGQALRHTTRRVGDVLQGVDDEMHGTILRDARRTLVIRGIVIAAFVLGSLILVLSVIEGVLWHGTN